MRRFIRIFKSLFNNILYWPLNILKWVSFSTYNQNKKKGKRTDSYYMNWHNCHRDGINTITALSTYSTLLYTAIRKAYILCFEKSPFLLHQILKFVKIFLLIRVVKCTTCKSNFFYSLRLTFLHFNVYISSRHVLQCRAHIAPLEWVYLYQTFLTVEGPYAPLEFVYLYQTFLTVEGPFIPLECVY